MLSNKLFLFAGFCSFILFLLISYQGFGSTVDAEAYLYAAKSFLNEHTFLTPFGYYTNWTPLFPFLIAIFGLNFVQYTAFLLNIILLYQIGGFVLSKNSLSHFLFFIHSIFSVIFLMIHFFVWSEAWFLVFLLGLFGAYTKASNKKKLSKQILLIMIILTNLLCLQRMAGVFFIVSFATLIAFRFSLKKAVFFALTSSISISAWFVRNRFLQNKPDFLENIFMISWQESLTEYSKALFNNFFPSYWLSEMSSIALLLILLFYFIYLLFREKEILALVWLCLCYLIAMFVLRMNVIGESERYLAPIQPFLLLIFWYLVEKGNRKIQIRKYLYIGLCLMLAFQMLRTAKNVKQWWLTPPNLITITKKIQTQCYTISPLLVRA